MVIGIIGKIGSGKSVVSEYLINNYNAIAFNCDDVAKKMIAEGDSSLDFDFTDDIFTNEKKQEDIRIDFHPLVFLRIKEQINNLYNLLNKNNKNNFFELVCDKTIINDNRFQELMNFTNFLNKNNFENKNSISEQLIIIESALPSIDMFNMCDKIIFVDSSYEDRSKRLKEKRGYTDLKIRQIDDSQKFYEKFYDRADYKIVNAYTKADLEDRVKEVMDEIYFTGK